MRPRPITGPAPPRAHAGGYGVVLKRQNLQRCKFFHARVTSSEASERTLLRRAPARRARTRGVTSLRDERGCHLPAREGARKGRALEARSAGAQTRVGWCGRSHPTGEDGIQDAGQDDRLTVAEAADRLGITKEAVRKRITRHTLRSDKDADGAVWVYVPAEGTAGATESLPQRELIAELRARIEDLRTDRDAWRDQARRSDYMASTAMERTRELEDRLRELEAPAGEASEPPESPVSTGPSPTPTDAGEGRETGVRRPWWRRVLGG